MAYDPIIHFYDDPGHPYWPNKNGGSGGGGGFEPKGMNDISILSGIIGTGPLGFKAGTNEPSTDGPAIMFEDANVCGVTAGSISVCGGLNVLATVPLASSVDVDSVIVFRTIGGENVEVPSTKKVFTPPSGDRMLFIVFKTPEVESGGTASLFIGLPSYG